MTTTEPTIGDKIGYGRCSTKDQSTDDQVRRLEADGCVKVFVDHGKSGKLASRPEWDKALAYLRPGDTLVVTKLDRAGRSVAHLIELASKLHEQDVHLRVLDQQIDTSTAMGKMFYTILGAFAEFERNLIVERTHEGLRTARELGHKSGRKMKLSDKQQAEVRRMHADGRTIVDIAEMFSVSRPVIYRILEAAQKAA
jgi:DNA invertase Pin-like site-specific DNA recombinase